MIIGLLIQMLKYREKTSKCKGFTLIELLVTLAIIAVVATIGLPTFTQSVRNSRLTTNVNGLVTSLNFARSEAIKRGGCTTVRRNAGAALAQWELGWRVFIDLDCDGNGIDEGDAVDTVLRDYEALSAGFTLRATGINRVTYQPSGTSAASSFVLCENSDGNNLPESNTSRIVIINAVGRVRMGIDIDNDGIPEKTDGEIVSCTASPFT